MVFDAPLKKRLRARAHPLKPTVMIGQHGYTAAVAAAIDEALVDHELIKVRMRGVERDSRKAVVAEMCNDLDAEFVGLVGSVVTLYRERPPVKG